MTKQRRPRRRRGGAGNLRALAVRLGGALHRRGRGLGALAPGLFGALAALEVASVNLSWPC
jgi:hypothetical protein